MGRPEETPRAPVPGRENGHAPEGREPAPAGGRRKRFGPEFIPLNLSAPFIRRPVATTLLTIAVTLAGMVAFFLLPVAPLPEVDFPVVRVQANMPGASPETMAATVATPLERALGRIAGVTEMTSSSSLGSTRIILQFDLDRDINGAARDVQAAINAARSTLPTMPSNPTYRKVNPSGAPILILSVTSDVLSRTQLYDAASTVLAQKISQIAGVGEVTVGGGALPAVRVDISPDALHRTGLSMEDVRAALAGANAFLPKGHLENEDTSWTVVASDQLRTAAQYRKVIVAERDGVTIRLGDVATVTDSSQDIRQMALSNGKPSILLIVFRSPGANIIETVDRVKAMIPQLRSWLPESADLSVRMDRSQTIRASLHEVEKSLLLSMALVVLVVFLFLRNGRATSIPAVAAPVSLIGTFGVMYLCGYTLDNLSLMALTVATGFVVDDAIVVLENIVRRLEMGEKPLRAALRGAREVGFTVISISLSLVAVFIPILFMGGVVGRLFREFSVVLATAVLVSMLVSLTTTPMMCATLLRPFDEELSRRSARLRAGEGGRQGIFTRAGQLWGRFLSSMQEGYSRSLYVVLDHWKLTLTVLLLVVAANVWMYIVVPKGFFPQQDTGVIMGGIRADQSASFQDMEVKLARLVRILSADPAVDQVSAHISGGRGGGGVFISLKPLEERGISAQQVIARLRGKMSSEPGLQIFLQAAQDIMMGGRSSRSQYQYTLQADDLDSLRRWGRRLQQEFAAIPILKDVDSDIEERGLQTLLTVNRDALARLGLTMKDVDAALNNAFGQRQVSTIYEEKNQYRVVLEYALPWLEGEDSLGKVWLPGKDGAVPLLGVAEVSPAFAPLSVAHQGQFAAVTLSFNLAEGASLSQAQAAIDEARVRIGMPSTIVGSFQGTAKMYSDTVKEQALLILAALAALYIVLGVLYESLIHPLTILSTLPSAGIGALLALRACGMEFSVIALIGVLLLCGIVKKNAIMMIDFAIEAARTRNLPPREAIHEACRLRFRPIMMTTAAAILGAVPLALGQGDGAEIRQPLGITIVGGLLVSQLLTLYTTPVVYLCLDRARLRWRRRWWRLRYGERKAALLTALCRQG
ncbi:efflux RND transporter permease subunit [Desulfovibrio piger]|uniref:Cobalt-zinc-cadmium resistance protein CzcA Cation efflux system protein CusA n=2 Tax=Desulfovibrio piger TaxID=901 RepID=A0A1K1LEN1_9BACT|nr:efflux RND transporter permease subunit [Desulfovibrio piger]SFV73157.1 Cobalt-zinc-cadmium resistance protein CzcA; Cation efflux system protein CusA [Desulfovibrio piger]